MTHREGEPPFATLPEVLFGADPDATAIVFRPLAGGRRVVSYGELRRGAAGVARLLGDARGRRVGLLAPNRPEWLAAAFGIWEAGGVLVSLNTWWRREELTHALRLAEVSTLIMQRAFLDRDYAADLAAARPDLPALRRVFDIDAEAFEEAAPAAGTRAAPEDPALVLFTSGTTAAAKGVLHRHDAILRNAWNISARQLLSAEDVVWMNFPLFFAAGLINATAGALCRGAAIVMQERFDAAGAIALIEQERCTVFQSWPTAVREMARHPAFPAADLSSLGKGTGPLDLGGPLKRSGGAGVNMYGLTETCTAVACTRGDDPPEIRARTQGTAMPGVEIRICEPVSGAQVPQGEAGEIRVRGYPVMAGYLGSAEQPFDAEGFLRTGDLGTLDSEGRLRFLGRLGDTIKTQGINVSPAEVESVLVRHPSIRAAAVLGLPDPADPLEERVYAAVVLEDGATLDADGLRAFCAEHLAAYKVPAIVEALPALPLDTTGGKVRKSELREAALQTLARTGGAS